MAELGVDIGGTFTDVVCRVEGAPLRVLKVPSTRQNPSEAVFAAARRLEVDHGIKPGEIARFIHGTTVATNAVIERKGPKIGLLTTEGFRDILEIGRQSRRALYAAVLEPEEPGYLAPGAFRHEIRERLDHLGAVVTPLDEGDVREAAERLVQDGAMGIAICFLHAFANPSHERRAAQIIRTIHPGLALSLSSEVDPAFREYERTVVTAFDAYIKPVIDAYLADLEAGLARLGIPAPLQIMQSRGGITCSEVARQRPVRLFLSGPAAGVIGARIIGKATGNDDLISVDIGGTSSDIALIRGGEPVIRPQGHVAGYDIRVPMADVNAIGAGGGSVAWIDGAGGLRVGPHSAAADPGPACYGRGGRRPTVTDASIVLGYLDPDYFAGGTLRLRPELAFEVIEETVARPLGLTVEAAALGIHRVINAQMTEGIRLVSIRQGFDPRDFALLPLGGAGGIHGAALASELGITLMVIARHPGVLSALGLLSAPIEHEKSQGFAQRLDSLCLDALRDALNELDDACNGLMAKENVAPGHAEVRYFADVCHVGQSHYLEVGFTPDATAAEQIHAGFLAAHRRVFGHVSADAPAEIVNLRAVHRVGDGDAAEAAIVPLSVGRSCRGERAILVPGMTGRIMAAIHARDRMMPGTRVDGPAVIEQPDTTTLVPPGWCALTRADGNIEMRHEGAPT